MNIQRKNKIIDMAIFAVMMLVVSAITLQLFYWQCTGNPQRYHSDMKAYILEMQGLDSGYSFPYPVFFKLSALIHLFTSPELAVAIATMLLNSGAMVVTKLAMNHLLLKKEDGWLQGVFISAAAISLFFISMIYTSPLGIYLPGIKYNYLGVFTPNPFHNATYMAARPFAILAFLWYVKLLPVYEQGLDLRNYICFSVFLLLATMTKPSFTLIMVSCAGLLMLYRMIRSKFRNFVPTVQLGLCFVPTFIDLLYQYKGVFVPGGGEEGGIGFGFGDVWGKICANIPLAVCLAIGFPLLVLLLNWKKYKKNTAYLFAWQLYVVSFLEAFLLYEKGFRKPDFNFSWGYMYGIFFCHFGALLMLMTVTLDFVKKARKTGSRQAVSDAQAAGVWKSGRMQAVLLVLQWLAYFCHLACGLLYFSDFYTGKMYY